jgi:hypothetical protein
VIGLPFCAKCGRELPIGANFCGSCGGTNKDNASALEPSAIRPSRTRRNIALAVVLVFLILFAVGAMSPRENMPQGNLVSTSDMRQYDATIRYTEKFLDNISYSQPTGGFTYLVVRLEIQNHVDKNFRVGPSYFSVTVNNVKYDYDGATYWLPDGLKSVELLKGGMVPGSLAFEVPVGTRDYTLTYEGLLTWPEIQWIHY